MNELTSLIALIEKEEVSGLTYLNRVEKFKLYADRFEEIQAGWTAQIKQGIHLDIEPIQKLLENALEKRREHHEYPNPKQINTAYILTSFLERLHSIKYLMDEEFQKGSCNCLVRVKHSLAPEISLLKKIGVSMDWVGAKFDILQCEQCSTKWVKDNAGGAGIIIDQWKKWDKEEFPLEGSE